FVEDSSHVGVVVIFQKAIHFGYHLWFLLVALAMAQWPWPHQGLRHAPTESNVKLDLFAFSDGDVFDQATEHPLPCASSAALHRRYSNPAGGTRWCVSSTTGLAFNLGSPMNDQVIYHASDA